MVLLYFSIDDHYPFGEVIFSNRITVTCYYRISARKLQLFIFAMLYRHYYHEKKK